MTKYPGMDPDSTGTPQPVDKVTREQYWESPTARYRVELLLTSDGMDDQKEFRLLIEGLTWKAARGIFQAGSAAISTTALLDPSNTES